MSRFRLPQLYWRITRARYDYGSVPQRLEEFLAQGIALHSWSLGRALRRGQVVEATGSRLAIQLLLAEGQALKAMSDSLRGALQPHSTHADAAIVSSDAGVPTYWISSSTLAQAHAHLTRRLSGSGERPEWMLAVTGLHVGSLRTLESLIDVRLGTQSGGRASFDMRHFTEVALSLMEHGQALHGIFHSHRFSGPPSPSGTDSHLQRVVEEGGYPAIQAVFSEDGYVRFFADRQFAIRIHGKGAEHVEGQLYRIVHFGTLPHPTLAG